MKYSILGQFHITKRVLMCIVIVSAASCGSLARGEDKPTDLPSARTLEALVSELLQLELEENKEETTWREHRGHMDAMIALLKAEKQQLQKAIESLRTKERSEQTERERLVARISEMKAALLGVAKSATEAGRDILAEYEKLPVPLQERLKSGARLLRTRLDEKPSADRAVELLRTVVAFSQDMQRILSEIHAVKKVLALEDGQRLEVDVLYLGGAIGFYLTSDQKGAGVLKRSDGKWTRKSRNEIAPQVALALGVKRKEKPPTLVALPLPPPAKAEPEEKGKERNNE